MPFDEYVQPRDKLVQWMQRRLRRHPRRPVSQRRRRRPARPRCRRPGRRGAAGASFELDGGGLLADVDPAGQLVPSLVTESCRACRRAPGSPSPSTAAWPPEQCAGARATRSASPRCVPPTAFAAGADSVDLIAASGEGPPGGSARLPGAVLATGWRLAAKRGRSWAALAGRLAVADSATPARWTRSTSARPRSRSIGHAPRGRIGCWPSPAPASWRRACRPPTGNFHLRGWTGGPRPGSPDAPVEAFAIVGRRAVALPPPKAP